MSDLVGVRDGGNAYYATNPSPTWTSLVGQRLFLRRTTFSRLCSCGGLERRYMEKIGFGYVSGLARF